MTNGRKDGGAPALAKVIRPMKMFEPIIIIVVVIVTVVIIRRLLGIERRSRHVPAGRLAEGRSAASGDAGTAVMMMRGEDTHGIRASASKADDPARTAHVEGIRIGQSGMIGTLPLRTCHCHGWDAAAVTGRASTAAETGPCMAAAAVAACPGCGSRTRTPRRRPDRMLMLLRHRHDICSYQKKQPESESGRGESDYQFKFGSHERIFA
mmetsp:Transcript_970/g.2253  ORF Transcript_970/g.2253 Transcript_970/m.2253 type:complete len:209 (-) Transcript_970:344-970(-)